MELELFKLQTSKLTVRARTFKIVLKNPYRIDKKSKKLSGNILNIFLLTEFSQSGSSQHLVSHIFQSFPCMRETFLERETRLKFQLILISDVIYFPEGQWRSQKKIWPGFSQLSLFPPPAKLEPFRKQWVVITAGDPIQGDPFTISPSYGTQEIPTFFFAIRLCSKYSSKPLAAKNCFNKCWFWGQGIIEIKKW